MIGLLLRCYPARWRDRYGEEFAAVLAERPLGPFDVADVLLGAVDAQLHLRGLGAADGSARTADVSSRIGGLAAILGGALNHGAQAIPGYNEGIRDRGARLRHHPHLPQSVPALQPHRQPEAGAHRGCRP